MTTFHFIAQGFFIAGGYSGDQSHSMSGNGIYFTCKHLGRFLHCPFLFYLL